MKRKAVALGGGILPMVILTGCSGGVGSSGFSLEKFFSNPIVIFLLILVIIWMYFQSRKGR